MNRLHRVGQLSQKTLLALLLAIVILVPLLSSENPEAWRGVRPILFEMMSLVLVGLALGRASIPQSRERIVRFLRTGPNLPILLLVLYGAVSWHRSPAPGFSAAEWIRLACGAALYFAVSATLHQRRQIKIVLGVLAAVAVLASLIGLMAYSQTDRTTISSSFGNAQLFAGFLLLLVPLLVALSFSNLELKHKIAIQSAAVLAVTSLLLAQVRSAWLGGVVALVALAVLALRNLPPARAARPRSQLVAPLVTILGAVGVFLILSHSTGLVVARGQTLGAAAHDVDFRWRVNEWKGAYQLIRERPLFGWGIGTFPLEQTRTVQGAAPRAMVQRSGPSLREEAHNEYLQLAAEMGIVGLGLYLWALGAFLVYGTRALRGRERGLRRLVLMGCLAALAGQAIDALSNPAWRFADVSFMFWLIMGLGMAAARFTPATAEEAAPAPARRTRQLGRLGWQAVTLAFTLFAMSGAWAAQYSDDEATTSTDGQAASGAAGQAAAGLAGTQIAGWVLLGLVVAGASWYGATATSGQSSNSTSPFRGFSGSPAPHY
jgi:O-antigen ligase